MRLAAWIIKASSWIVPSDQRTDWRREWLGELRLAPGLKTRPPRGLRFALGAPFHALWLRKDAWRPALLIADLRFGLRQIRRRPGLATAAILTLAIGAGATTAIFSVVYGVLLKPLPYRDPTTLVQLWETNPLFNWTEAAIAPGNLLSWKERNRSFSDVAYYFATATREGGLQSLTLGGEQPARVQGLGVSSNFFDVLGVRAASGRMFVPTDAVIGQHRVLILSDRFWRSQFGADPAIVDKPVTLNGLVFKVIGVAPPEFRFDLAVTDFWMPSTLNLQEVREVRRPHYLRAVARLKPGVTIEQARADIAALAKDLEREYPATNTQMGASLGPIDDWFVGQTRRPLLLFLGAVALVLFIACANVTNLMLARALERVSEMSVRAALGASRARLIRQLLIEALVVAGCGALLGLGIAAAGVELFIRFAPVTIPRLGDVRIDPVVLMFCSGLMAITTVAVGLVPAIWGARANLRDALGSSSRTTTGQTAWVRRMLVGAEVALAVVLVVGATMTLRSFAALLSIDPGVPVESQISGRVSLPNARYGQPGQASAFFEEASTRLRAGSGVVSAGAAAQLPLEGASWTSQFFIEDRPDFHGYELRHKAATTGYLEALGVRLIAGRTFTSEDRSGAPLSVVANEAFVRKYMPGETAVGRRLTWDPRGPNVMPRTIVGVVSDEPQDAIGAPVAPEVYYPLAQEERREMSLLVRSSLPADAAIGELRRVVREIDPQVALFNVNSMSDAVSRSLAKPRIAAWLVGGFAGVALLLAIIGIYGVTAWAVTARQREFGIRLACGAARADVFRLVLRQDLRVVGIGMVVGVALAAGAAKAAGSMLFGVTAGDAVSYIAALTLLLIAGIAACLGPARRASRVDPVAIMRS
jgi:putative ABC transport system permease protein